MTYTTNNNDDKLLYGNEWDDFTSDVLEEFEEKPRGRGRGCLRVIILLLLILILLGAGAFYIMNRASEEEASTFEEASSRWLDDASIVVTNYDTAIAGETLDCTAVMEDETAFLLGDIPGYEGSDEKLLAVHSLMNDIDQQIKLLRSDISRVCGTNQTVSNNTWINIVRPENKLTNARNFIQQAEDSLGAAE